MAGCADVAWTVAFTGRCCQRELAYGKDFAADVGHRAVHHARLVVEDAQRGGFGGEPADIVVAVAFSTPTKIMRPGLWAV